jgi:hypothetical protein
VGLSKTRDDETLIYKLLTLSTGHPLAQDFDILLGKYNVTVPKDTAPGKDYQLVRK